MTGESIHAPRGQSPQLHIYTGDGKGKTTAAVGLAVRAAAFGLRVVFIQFDKGHKDEEHYNERKVLRNLPGIRLEPTGIERMRPGRKFRFGVTEEDRAESRRALDMASEALTSGECDVLILDEILSAATYKLISEDDIRGLVDRFRSDRSCEMVLTGRGASPSLMESADLVTEMVCRKHYFDAGVPARPGIDY